MLFIKKKYLYLYVCKIMFCNTFKKKIYISQVNIYYAENP